MKLLLTLAILGASAGTAVVAAPPSAGAEPGGIRWHQCALNASDEEGAVLDDAGAQCGELRVPLDYSRAGGPELTLAMSRFKATGKRIGVLVMNSGGPGGPSLSMPLELRDALKDVGSRYDLIGLDPRFVGRSTPIDCKLPIAGWPWGGGSTYASFARGTEVQADLAERCAREAGPILRYVSTRNAARDLDRVRIALGEQKISYLGESYGSYLGAVYLQMFPGRTDRVVLDGPVDPAKYGPRLLQPVGAVNEAALRAWATWAAERDAKYRLGTTTAQVMANVDRIYRAAPHGLRIGKHTVDDGLLPMLLFASLGDDRDPARADAAEIVQVLLKAVDGPVQPDANLGELLDAILSPAMSPTISAQTAIVCADNTAPRNPKVYWRDIQKHRTTEPHFGSLTRMISPCAFWPVRPQEPPTRVANAEHALIIAADGDPRTIYPNAAILQRDISGSRVLTIHNARKHVIFGAYGNTCADHTVVTYLRSGTLPPNTAC